MLVALAGILGHTGCELGSGCLNGRESQFLQNVKVLIRILSVTSGSIHNLLGHQGIVFRIGEDVLSDYKR